MCRFEHKNPVALNLNFSFLQLFLLVKFSNANLCNLFECELYELNTIMVSRIGHTLSIWLTVTFYTISVIVEVSSFEMQTNLQFCSSQKNKCWQMFVQMKKILEFSRRIHTYTHSHFMFQFYWTNWIWLFLLRCLNSHNLIKWPGK